MKRYHEEQHIIERNFRERLRLRLGYGSKKQEQRGRYRKHDAYDCRHTRCFMCHGGKLNQEPTLAERRSRRAFREQLVEAF